MTETYDLIVIGGGPGGTSAAITTARAGWSVLLFERGSFPRHKVCGEFVSAESLELLRWLLGSAHCRLIENAAPISESRLFLDGRCLRVPLNPPAASITRYELDLALWRAAGQAGVRTLERTHVQQIETRHEYRVITSAGEFTGRALINASGRWSNLNRGTVKGAARGRRLGLKAHYHGEMEAGTELYFFDGGYCGVQAVPSTKGMPLLNVCALVRQGTAETLDEVLRRHPVLESCSRSWNPAFPPLSTFPAVFQEPEPVSGSMVNVGDAAGFVDPFVGDGISLALRSGSLAAEKLGTFLQNESTLDGAFKIYEQKYRQTLRPVYRASSLLRGLLGIPRRLRRPLLSACEMSPWLSISLLRATRSRATDRVP